MYGEEEVAGVHGEAVVSSQSAGGVGTNGVVRYAASGMQKEQNGKESMSMAAMLVDDAWTTHSHMTSWEAPCSSV